MNAPYFGQDRRPVNSIRWNFYKITFLFTVFQKKSKYRNYKLTKKWGKKVPYRLYFSHIQFKIITYITHNRMIQDTFSLEFRTEAYKAWNTCCCLRLKISYVSSKLKHIFRCATIDFRMQTIHAIFNNDQILVWK